MTKGTLGGHVRVRRLVLALATTLTAAAIFMPATALAVAPFDGTTVSPGLGPTFGDPWCANAAAGTSIANQQGAPLALIPYEAVGCTLDKIQGEATAAGIPHRMNYSIIGQSAGGRNMYGVVVNALESVAQQRDYARWQQLRALELTDPAAAQILLNSWGGDVKMPIFIEANIHGDEEEGADAIMQVLRDIVTTPYGVNPTVDKILDHTILIVIPNQNPDGRFNGTRANSNGFDMNRDFIVQSQSETRTSVKLQQEWLATVGLAMHGYVNPTLIDGLTKPHNPGLEYDLFAYWNQRRLDANQAALAAVGMGITRPVNMFNSGGGGTNGNPAIAEGWDDWGPFYTQTYMAFYGPDSSTLEMCSSGAGCNGRFGSKRAQYIGFYSSADYWIDNRAGLMRDQVEAFRRGVADADRVPCCTDSLLTLRGFTEAEHNWMVPYPKAYVIPFGGGQRSDAEANRMAKWLLDNGILVQRMTSDFTWGTNSYKAGSYVVYMNQALRGLALTVLSAGQDISARITQLYAPPGAWSHGLMWGADVVEIPRGDASFTPATTPISAPNSLNGGLRDGMAASSDFYSVTLQGPIEVRAALALLRSGVDGRDRRGELRLDDRRDDAGRLAHLPERPGHEVGARRRRPGERDVVRAQRRRDEAGDDADEGGAEGRDPREQRQPGQLGHVAVAAGDLRVGCDLRLHARRGELDPERRDGSARWDRRHLQHRPGVPGHREQHHGHRRERGGEHGHDHDDRGPQPPARRDRDHRRRRRGRLQRHVGRRDRSHGDDVHVHQSDGGPRGLRRRHRRDADAGPPQRVLRPRRRLRRDRRVGDELHVPLRRGSRTRHEPVHADELGRRRRDHGLGQRRRGQQPDHGRLPGDGLPVHAVERHLLHGDPDGGGHRRPQQREHGRHGAERPVARLRRGSVAKPRGDLKRRTGRRPREHDGVEPLRRLLGEPVLPAGRRA